MIIIGAIMAAALAADDAEARLTAKTQACISAGAAESERLNPKLDDAVEFLIADLCASEIEVRERYKSNVKWLASLRSNLDEPQFQTDFDDENPRPLGKKAIEAQTAKTREAYAKAYVDPQSGELVMPVKAPGGGLGNILEVTYTSASRIKGPSDLRAFAARAVLEAREARLKSESAK